MGSVEEEMRECNILPVHKANGSALHTAVTHTDTHTHSDGACVQAYKAQTDWQPEAGFRVCAERLTKKMVKIRTRPKSAQQF